jgi:cytochrome c-type biogenesis protein CcmE
MTRRRRRLFVALGGTALLTIAVLLVLNAMRDNLVFFYSPSEVAQKQVAPGRALRIGGLVEPGSVQRRPGQLDITFRVTDLKREVPVHYTGALPDLFREGQGVVAEGTLTPGGTFEAHQVLAKHDERYMPPEVAAALKKSGRWQEGEMEAAKDLSRTRSRAPEPIRRAGAGEGAAREAIR